MKYINFIIILIAFQSISSNAEPVAYFGVRTYCFFRPKGQSALTYEKLKMPVESTMAYYDADVQAYYMPRQEYIKTLAYCHKQVSDKGEIQLLKATDPTYPESLTSFYPLKPGKTSTTRKNYQALLNALGITRDDLKAAFSDEAASYKDLFRLSWSVPENFVDSVKMKAELRLERYVQSNEDLFILYISGLISSYWFYGEKERDAYIPGGILLIYDVLTEVILGKKADVELISTWIEEIRPSLFYTSYFVRGPNVGVSLLQKLKITSLKNKDSAKRIVVDALQMLKEVNANSTPANPPIKAGNQTPL